MTNLIYRIERIYGLNAFDVRNCCFYFFIQVPVRYYNKFHASVLKNISVIFYRNGRVHGHAYCSYLLNAMIDN